MLLRWRRRDVDAQTDRELTELFSHAAGQLQPDAMAMQRAQARVAAKLAAPSVEASGGLRRKLALGTLGGGALWATALGSAAAHKAAAVAVVGGLLLGGGVVAEQTGVGEAVRETVGIQRAFEALTSQGESGDPEAASAGEGTATPASPTATAAVPGGATVETEAAPEGLPGQLRTVLQPDGGFNLRAVLQGYGPSSIDVYIAGAVGTGSVVTLDLDTDAELNVPGKPGGESGTAQLEGYLGRLVTVLGSCDAAAEDLGSASGCTVSRVQVLGGPADTGQSGSSSSGLEQAPGQDKDKGPESNPGQGTNQGQGQGGATGATQGVDGEQGTEDGEPGPPEHSSAGGNDKGNGKPPE
jgi:hypothetical protein